MTTKAQLRKAALALPETEESTHDGLLSFKVGGKRFASLADDGRVQLRLPDDRVSEVLAEHPSGERVEHAGKPIGLRIPLADVNGMVLNALVRAAWSHRAPKRLADSVIAAESGGGDLPPQIGRPATRALSGAGLDTLDRIASKGEAELLALHGVGPKAVRVLRRALEERGQALRP
ncbi:MmcQ/YjbR family DNA-binding protein [Glycomyces salinus]|uniref:MmcQ/YjbR family DNA-binding protein n=1 Tax=Glycomyces salinus TaxID=980294 RepID=UPI0018EB2141|nr:hypothetical protein [Glycomyces salinus]